MNTQTRPTNAPRKRHLLATLGAGLAALLAMLVLVVAGIWLWLGTQDSAQTAASWVNRWVPHAQLSNVTGSLRGKAHIGGLTWQDANNKVSATNLDWAWDLQLSASQVWQHAVLRNQTSQVGYPTLSASLAIGDLELQLTPQSTPDSAPFALPRDIALPLALHARLTVDRVQAKLDGATHTVSELDLSYDYAGGQGLHQLQIDKLRWNQLTGGAQLSVNSFGSWPISAQLNATAKANALAKRLPQTLGNVTQSLSAEVSLVGNLAPTEQAGETGNVHIEPASLEVKAFAYADKQLLVRASATVHPWDKKPLHQASVTLNQLDLAAWLPANSDLPATLISGGADIAPNATGQWLGQLSLKQPLSAQLPAATVSAQFELDSQHVSVRNFELTLAPAKQTAALIKGDATLQLDSGQLSATLQGRAPGVELQTQISVNTRANQQSLAGLPVGDLALQVSDAAQLAQWLQQLAKLNALPPSLDIDPSGAVQLDASFSKGGQVQLQLKATELAATLSGQRVQLHTSTLELSNTWQDLKLSLYGKASATGIATNLVINLDTQLGIGPKRPSDVTWRGLSWQLSGVDSQQRAWHARTTSPWAGSLTNALTNAQAKGNAAGIRLGPQTCIAQDCLVQVNWQAWSASAQSIDFSGTLSNLQARLLNEIAPKASPNWRSNLLLSANWRARLGPNVKPDVQVSLKRTSGDIEIRSAAEQWQALGLDEVSIEALWQDKSLAATVTLNSSLAGTVKGDVRTQLVASGWGVKATPQARLDGQLQVKVNELAWLSPWLSPTLQLGGNLQAALQLGGTHSKPQPTGLVSASGLTARHKYGDFDVGGGELQARLDQQGIDLQRLYLHGVENQQQGGYASATGRLDWPGVAKPSAANGTQGQIDLKLVGFQAASKADRRIRISGDLASTWQAGLLSVSGDLNVDQADITLAKLGSPSLGDDVVIVGRTEPAPPSALPLALDISLSLGDDFKVKGFGLTTGLSGTLLISGPDAYNQPILNGEVNTVDARYKAYGQDLLVQRGRLLFAGRPDAPQLDVLAIRALTEPQVGVQVQGPLKAPKVSLYANVAMADSEKLSWLLLGHPSARGGSEAALIQSAVLALVGDTNALIGGVDEFSIEGETRLSDGSTRAAQLTVGKQLGERLYTSYTRSVASVQGLLSIYLKFTNSLALRAQTGEANNVDLVWSRAYD